MKTLIPKPYKDIYITKLIEKEFFNNNLNKFKIVKNELLEENFEEFFIPIEKKKSDNLFLLVSKVEKILKERNFIKVESRLLKNSEEALQIIAYTDNLSPKQVNNIIKELNEKYSLDDNSIILNIFRV